MKIANRERFERIGSTVMESGCHHWNGWCDPLGYGRFSYYNDITDSYSMLTASRAAYLIYVERIDNSLIVRHTCDNPTCVNIDHLLAGTSQDNSDDMVARGRSGNAPHPGETNGNSILTEKDVIKLRSINYYHGFYKEMALYYNINIEAIRAAYFGRTWSHLNNEYPPLRLR